MNTTKVSVAGDRAVSGSVAEQQLARLIAAAAPELTPHIADCVHKALLGVYRTPEAAIAGLRRGAVNISNERSLV